MKKNQEIPIVFKSSFYLLRGIFHKPKSLKKKFPVVVFCHGYFQSNKIGPLALYVQLARALATNEIACLRFDLSGFGESEGDYLKVSYKSMNDDLRNAIGFIENIQGVDKERLGIIGHSLGGNIGLHVASSFNSIKLLCMLSPNPTDNQLKVKIFTGKEMNEMYDTGTTLRKRIPASINVYKQINDGISFIKAKTVKAKTLIIYGEQDPYYDNSDYIRFSQAFKIVPEIHSIPNADHNFLPITSRTDLITKTITWITNVFKI